jgi:hypothetical protein
MNWLVFSIGKIEYRNLWCYRKDGEDSKCQFSGEEETTLDIYAVIY